MTDVILFVAIVGLFWWLAQKFGGAQQKRTQKLIERIKNRKSGSTKSMQEMSLRRKTTTHTGLIQWLMKPLPDFKKLGDRLERTGSDLTPKQFVLRCVLAMLIIMLFVSGLLHKSILLGFFLGIILAVWLPLKLVQRKINKENKAFLQLFPDAIDLIVRGLRSGLPVSESLVLVSQEVPNPVGKFFGTVSATMKLGVPMEKALTEMAKKLEMREFNFFVTSIILQRETGGNLSEILNNLSEVLRNRYLMRMKIHAMSSEARASTKIIGALPPVVMAAVSALNPEYMKPLFTTPGGNMALGIAMAMMAFGIWVMNRMAKFEI